MPHFRKKPVVIEAIKLPSAEDFDVDEFQRWAESVGFTNWVSGRNGTLEIETLEGTMAAQPGDWIVKGVKGEFYPVKPDVFAATYEAE
jgi:hypothetical protein